MYNNAGTQVTIPPENIVLSGVELMAAIQNSTAKGIYNTRWNADRNDWNDICNAHNAMSCFYELDSCFMNMTQMVTPQERRRHSRSEVEDAAKREEQHRAEMMREFKETVAERLAHLKTLTVRITQYECECHSI